MARRNRDPRFALRLRRMVSERGMSMREFSERSGVSQPSVYAYANGERVPDVTRLRAIRATLGCTWDELLGD